MKNVGKLRVIQYSPHHHAKCLLFLQNTFQIHHIQVRDNSTIDHHYFVAFDDSCNDWKLLHFVCDVGGAIVGWHHEFAFAYTRHAILSTQVCSDYRYTFQLTWKNGNQLSWHLLFSMENLSIILLKLLLLLLLYCYQVIQSINAFLDIWFSAWVGEVKC